MICFRAITGAEIPVMIQGQVLSILLALAISNAPALHGLANESVETGCAASAPEPGTG